jgi:hypothetical protein
VTIVVAAAIASGLLSAWVFSHTMDLPAVRSTLRQIHAHFLEFRLFFDEPRLIWRAQKALLAANLRICALLLPPTLILVLPMAWLITQLNTVSGVAPLSTGEAAVVTAQLATGLLPVDGQSSLEAPPGIVVETPPLRIVSERQLVWRIRPLKPVTGLLRFNLRGVTLSKAVAAGDRGTFLLRRRERSLFAFLTHPEEPRLPAGSALWLEVDYPPHASWWIAWFVLVSSVSTLLFAKWL